MEIWNKEENEFKQKKSKNIKTNKKWKYILKQDIFFGFILTAENSSYKGIGTPPRTMGHPNNFSIVRNEFFGTALFAQPKVP